MKIQHIILLCVSTLTLGLTACATAQSDQNSKVAMPEHTIEQAQNTIAANSITTTSISLAAEMKKMAASYRAFNTATSQQEALSALNDLRLATIQAGQVKPSKVQNDAALVEGYQQSLLKMLEVIDQSIALVEQNQLEKAKENAKSLNQLKDEAHSLYR